MQRRIVSGKHIFADYTSDKIPQSRIYKEVLQLKNIKDKQLKSGQRPE